MLKNRYGFVPNGYKPPDSYKRIFNGWCAIYRHPKTGQEYHVQLEAHPGNPEYARRVMVLRQDKDCRRQVGDSSSTIKGAVSIVERLLSA